MWKPYDIGCQARLDMTADYLNNMYMPQRNSTLSVYLWNPSTQVSSQYGAGPYISASLGSTLSIGSNSMTPYGYYNGYACYSGNGWYLWYATSYTFGTGWVLSSEMGRNTREYVEVNASTNVEYYDGDAWYFYSSSSAVIPYGASFTARGSGYGGSALTASWSNPSALARSSTLSSSSYMTTASPLGVYGTTSSYKIVGCLALYSASTYLAYSWIYQTPPDSTTNKSSFVDSDESTVISWNADLSAWVIGTVSTTAGTGYWKCAGNLPKYNGMTDATFTRVWNAEDGVSDPTPDSIVVKFGGYVLPSAVPGAPWAAMETVYNMQVGVCL